MNLAELRKQRAKALEDMAALVDLAKAQERNANDDESKRFNELDEEIRKLDAQIKQAERFEELQAERSRGTTAPVTAITVTREEGMDEHGNCIVWRSGGEQLMAVRRMATEPNSVDKADLYDTNPAGTYVKAMAKVRWVLQQKSAGTNTGTATITVLAASSNSGTGATAVPLRWRKKTTAVTSDAWNAVNDATAAGFTTVALAVAEAVRGIEEFAAGTARLMAKDFKPGNVVVRPRAGGNWDASVIDADSIYFTVFRDPRGWGQPVTATTDYESTPRYRPPEKLRDPSLGYTPAALRFMLAVTLFEVLHDGEHACLPKGRARVGIDVEAQVVAYAYVKYMGSPALPPPDYRITCPAEIDALYLWISSGTLPCFRVGAPGKRGKILIAAADLDLVMESCRVEMPPAVQRPVVNRKRGSDISTPPAAKPQSLSHLRLRD